MTARSHAARQTSPLPQFFRGLNSSRKFIGPVLVVLLLGLVVGCATSFDKTGRYHRVQASDSIWRIARFYRVPVQELAEWNNLQDPKHLKPGQKLYIPVKPQERSFKKIPTAEEEKSYSAPIRTERGRFIWPVKGKVTSPFGVRGGRRHDGIDIKASPGAPVKAAAAGKVAFSGRLSSYGKLVLLRHKDDYFTAYAHNSKILVKKGKKVKQGEVISRVGSTGRTTGCHLHFEIRHRQKARNPLFLLPVIREAQADQWLKEGPKHYQSQGVGRKIKSYEQKRFRKYREEPKKKSRRHKRVGG